MNATTTKNVKLPWMMTEVRPESGRAILVDGWNTHCPSILEDCECPEFAAFRLPSSQYTDIKYAVDVHITGRVAQRRPYQTLLWVKVCITFRHDGERPDTTVTGWMAV